MKIQPKTSNNPVTLRVRPVGFGSVLPLRLRRAILSPLALATGLQAGTIMLLTLPVILFPSVPIARGAVRPARLQGLEADSAPTTGKGA